MMTRDMAPGSVMLVSACLVGVLCRFDGRSSLDERVVRLARQYRLVPVCPEQLGGLPTPREPVELQHGRAISADGQDMTDMFRRGVEQVMRIALVTGARGALLQPRSPSCGVRQVYDGTFSGRLIPGRGMLAAALDQAGCRLFSLEDIDPE